MDEMRDRLIAAPKTAKDEIIDLDLKGLADKLIAAGVILPKFRIGQEVYIRTVKGEIQRRTVAGYYDFGGQKGVYLNGDMYSTDSKHIFATEAEARAALEGKE